MVIGDFDGDGKLDLAATNWGGGVSVLLGRGDGTFPDRASYPSGGDEPSGLVASDLDGDGRLDLAVVNQATGQVAVLINAGGGRFDPPVSYAAEGEAIAVAAGDLDGDHVPDLAVLGTVAGAGVEIGRITVLGNRGDGTFVARPSVVGGVDPRAIIVGDFTGDGHDDVAVASERSGFISLPAPSPSREVPSGVLLFAGDGSGGLAPYVVLVQGSAAHALATGDLDRDGRPDLVVAIDENPPLEVAVMLSAGRPGLRDASLFFAGGADAVQLADVNRDGRLDILVVDSFGTVSVLQAKAAGGFADAAPYSAGYAPTLLVAGDVNGDGAADAVTAASLSVDAYVTVLLNRGDGTLIAATALGPPGLANGLTLADLNRDGRLDLTFGTPGAGDGYPGSVQVYLGAAGGTLRATPAKGYIAPDATETALADLNGDGRLDVVVTNSYGGGISVLLGDGAGRLGPRADYPTGAGTSGIVVADLDGDGHADVAVTDSTDGAVSVLRGKGDGTFARATPYFVGSQPVGIAAADLTGDQKPDLVIANHQGEEPDPGDLRILLNRGDGTFTTFGQPIPTGAYTTAIAAVDLNADGAVDLAAANYRDTQLVVLLGDGSGGFARAGNYPVAWGTTRIAVGDLDRDGTPDLALSSYTGKVSVLANLGDGTFAPTIDYAAGNTLQGIAIGDIDGDGKLDLVTGAICRFTSLAILYNTGP